MLLDALGASVKPMERHIKSMPAASVFATCFEACRFGGAGDRRFTMNSAQHTSQVVLRVEVGFVTDFESKLCDDLRTRFGFEMSGVVL